MSLKRFSRLDGLSSDQEKTVLDALNAIVDELNLASAPQPVRALVTGAATAIYDDIVRVNAGGSMVLPPANASSASKRVGLMVVGAGSVRVTASPLTIAGGARQGTVNGGTSDSVVGPGLTQFESDGQGGWFSDSAVYSGALTAALVSATNWFPGLRGAVTAPAGFATSPVLTKSTAVPSSGGGSITTGTATLNFGAAPGRNVVTVAVPDAGVVAGSKIWAWIQGTDSTADHNKVEHQMLTLGPLSLTPSVIIPGISFVLQAMTPLRLTGSFTATWARG